MGTIIPPLHRLSDSDLLARVRDIVERERHITAQLIEALMELDARRLYLAEGYPSLFSYCTHELRLTEHAAYGRIEAARAARKYPRILQGLREGTLTLTAIGLVAPHLTPANADAVLDAVRRKTKREVEDIVARLAPRPDAKATLRRLPPARVVLSAIEPPETSAAATSADTKNLAAATHQAHTATPRISRAAERPAAVTALAPSRYRLQMTISRRTHDKLQRVRGLLRHSVPDGNLEEIFDRAITRLLEHAERSTAARCARPRATNTDATATRYVPAAMKRAVWARDGGRCAFRGTRGRCREVSFLEFHHVVPFAVGGATSVTNLELRCRAHNHYEADQWLGGLGTQASPRQHSP